MHILTDKYIKLFWAKVKQGDNDACWEWQGERKEHGHGRVAYRLGKDLGKRDFLAHRVAYVLANGQFDLDCVEAGKVIRHKCDNPPCCNPAHLLIGTQRDNIDDMLSRGRSNRGEKNGAAILTPEKVLQIRAAFATGKYTHLQLAKAHGISRENVGDIVRRDSWKHI